MNGLDEMDEDDMELYGDDNGDVDMNANITNDKKNSERKSDQANEAAKTRFWTVIYGEEGWLRV